MAMVGQIESNMRLKGGCFLVHYEKVLGLDF